MNQAQQPGGLRCHDPDTYAMGQKPCPTPAACCCAPTGAACAAEPVKEKAIKHYEALALEAKVAAKCLHQIAEPSPTAGMNIGQRILHVGGRENEAGYIEFGSIAAVRALVGQVLRDLQAAPAQEIPAEGETSRAQYMRMFDAACEALGEINEALGLDPEDGGAEPILEAIEKLKQRAISGMWTIWESLPGYLIDHCEGETITEEGLQRALEAMLKDPKYSMPPAQAQEDARVVAWAVGRWEAEVKNRPLVNVHRRTLDDTWRQVIRHFGGDPDGLVGPAHDELADAARAAQGGAA